MSEKVDRRRAYIYLTRRREGRLEVAVFRHPDHKTMVLGQQVPVGTIEPFETLEEGRCVKRSRSRDYRILPAFV